MAGETRYITWSGGPTGDYTTDGVDDQVEINQALSWAAANPNNTVYLRGPHTYTISAKLLMGSYTFFTGDSTAEIKLSDSCMWDSMVPIIAQINGGGTSLVNVEISNFKINGNEANLYHEGVGDPERIHGKGYYNCIYFQGSSSVKLDNINIHNMTFADSMGDGARIAYAKNVRVHGNVMNNLMHASVFLIEVDGFDVYDNNIKYITNAGVRTDNSANGKIRDNKITPWMERSFFGTPDGPTSASDGGDNAIQVGDEPASYGRVLKTQNIDIYNNDIDNSGIGGICVWGASGVTGMTTQNVHIFNNHIAGCGWGNIGVSRRAGIAIVDWGNGVTIEYNTISANKNAGIKIINSVTSGVTALVKNNNITGTVVSSTGGYGIWNASPSRMSVIAEGNYAANNAVGNYYQVTPVSEATSPITETLPGTGTGTDDVDKDSGGSDPIPDPGLDPSPEPVLDPVIVRYQREIDDSYYIPGRTGYVNKKPFAWAQKKVGVSNSLGQDKCPGVTGWALTDFDLEGCELVLDCAAKSLSEMHEAIAAFTQPGRIVIELGGDFAKWQASGVKGEYSTELKLGSIIPRNWHPYSFLLCMDQPYYESVVQRMRSRYIYNSMQFSADDCFTGNLIKNSSFEDWTPNLIPSWTLQPTPEDNEYRCIRYAKETKTFCAVSSTGTNRVILSDGVTWRLPAGSNVFDRGLHGLTYCPEWGMWVACSSSGTDSKAMASNDNGDTWELMSAMPQNDDNGWCYVLWIPPNEAVSDGRVILYAQSGTGYRSMYSEDMGWTWVQVATAIESNGWISAAYAPELKRIVVVAYDGSSTQRVMVSDDFGDSYTAQDSPALSMTSVIWADTLGLFVACADAPLPGTFSQIMTSPTGLSGTWTLRDVPVATQTVTPISGDVSTETVQTPDGHNYSSKTTDWSLGGGPIFETIAAPATVGHYYRIDKIFCKLRSEYNGVLASIKFTVQFGSGAEKILKEWTNSTTSFVSKSLDVSEVSAANESVTIRCYMKTSNGNYKAVNTDTGFEITEASSNTGGNVTYTYNKFYSLVWAREKGVLMAVSLGDENGGTNNGTIYSLDSVSWLPCALPASGGVYNQYSSICFAEDSGKFVAVAKGGIAGSRAMICSNYGDISDIAPDSWVLVQPGQSMDESTARDGLYSVKITGDGTTERGTITQKLYFDSGTRYILSGFGKVQNLTAGSLRVDILNGTSIVKELIWDVDTDWSQRKITFKFDVRPTDAYIRVRGYNLNSGAVVNCDKLLIEKASDYELSQTGADIATYGTEDTVPDIILTGVSSAPDSTTAGNTTTRTTDIDTNYTTKSTSYSSSAAPALVLPALANGAVYRIDEIHAKLKSEHSGTTAYIKVTMQTGSGSEVTLAEWTNATTSFVSKKAYPSKESVTGQTLTFRFWMRTASSSYKAIATEIGYKVTEMTEGAVSSSNIYMWNTADTSKVLACCNRLLPKYRMEINNDGTGSLTYAEDFLDDNYTVTAYAQSGVTYNSANKSLVIAQNGYIVFPMDCKYPVSGVPYLKANVFSGAPQIYIADNSGSGGAPGTYYASDDNQTTALSNAEIRRDLENENSLELVNKTKFYVKIAPYTGETCEFGSLEISALLVTMDAERFKIYATRKANTIAVQTNGKSSFIATLRYRDLDPAT